MCDEWGRGEGERERREGKERGKGERGRGEGKERGKGERERREGKERGEGERGRGEGKGRGEREEVEEMSRYGYNLHLPSSLLALLNLADV